MGSKKNAVAGAITLTNGVWKLTAKDKIAETVKVECYRETIFDKCKKFKVSDRKYLDDAFHCKVTDCEDAPSTYYCRESPDGDGYYFSVHNKDQECVTGDALRAQADALRAKLAASKLAAMNQKKTIEVPTVPTMSPERAEKCPVGNCERNRAGA